MFFHQNRRYFVATTNLAFAAWGFCLLFTAVAGATTWHVDQGHAGAADYNPGTAAQPFKTISKGAAVAEPGDTVLIGAGTYREHIGPAHGGAGPDNMITYQARGDDYVVIKSSELWTPPWKKIQLEGLIVPVWEASLDPALFSYDFPIENFNPFLLSPQKIYSQTVEDYYAPVRPAEAGQPLPLTRGALFLNGQPLRQITDSQLFDYATNVFLVSADGQRVLVRLAQDQPPQGLEFEIVTREQCFAPRDLRIPFLHLKGLHFEHAANGNGVPQMGMVSTSRGRNWIFEDCSFRWAGTCGLDVGDMAWYHPPGRGDDNDRSTGELDFTITIRRCTISDNGTAGVWSYGGGRSLLVEDCVIEGNNRLGWNTWEEAGIKCHGNQDSVIRNNLFRNNDSYGVWFDGPWGNNRITQNLFISNMNAGVFIEAEEATTLVDNNICAYSRPLTFRNMTQADGIYGHETSNIVVVHNLAFANTGFGVRLVKLSASYQQPYPEGIGRASNIRVQNNIIYANGRGAVSLPITQRLSSDNLCQGNFYWGATEEPLFELQRGVMHPQRMVERIEQALNVHHISPHQSPMLDLWKSGRYHPTVGEMVHNGPLVGLPLWQKLMEFDGDAVVSPIPVIHLYWEGRLKLHLRPPGPLPEPNPDVAEGELDPRGIDPDSYTSLGSVDCERLDSIRHDYFGRPRPASEPPTVGPIQGLERLAGGNQELVLELWPNAAANRPPGKEMRINIKPRPFRSVKKKGEWVQP